MRIPLMLRYFDGMPAIGGRHSLFSKMEHTSKLSDIKSNMVTNGILSPAKTFDDLLESCIELHAI